MKQKISEAKSDFATVLCRLPIRAFQIAIRIESIRFVMRIDSIRDANRFESIRFVKKSAFRFASCHAVFALNK